MLIPSKKALVPFVSVENMLLEICHHDFPDVLLFGEWLSQKKPTRIWTHAEITTEWETIKRYLYSDLRSQLAVCLCLSRDMILGRFYSGLQKHVSSSCSLMQLCDLYTIGNQWGIQLRTVLIQQCIGSEMERSLQMTSAVSRRPGVMLEMDHATL